MHPKVSSSYKFTTSLVKVCAQSVSPTRHNAMYDCYLSVE